MSWPRSPSSSEDLIRERVVAGIRRAQAQGRKLGRPRRYEVAIGEARRLLAEGLSLRAVARTLHVHPSAISRAIKPHNGARIPVSAL
jgi:putative DNA-invertase from lambdoid prophage Rac